MTSIGPDGASLREQLHSWAKPEDLACLNFLDHRELRLAIRTAMKMHGWPDAGPDGYIVQNARLHQAALSATIKKNEEELQKAKEKLARLSQH